jgi:hypothetical protein
VPLPALVLRIDKIRQPLRRVPLSPDVRLDGTALCLVHDALLLPSGPHDGVRVRRTRSVSRVVRHRRRQHPRNGELRPSRLALESC